MNKHIVIKTLWIHQYPNWIIVTTRLPDSESAFTHWICSFVSLSD